MQQTPFAGLLLGLWESPEPCSMASTSRMADKESVCGAFCLFSYFQTGLEGSENTDVWGIGVGIVVAVLQAVPCDLGTWIGTSASAAGGSAAFPASG